MEKYRRKERNQPLLIHFGKDTKATFDDDGNLVTIRVKPNKYGEFIGNRVVTKENIFDREYIGIISKMNAKTYVKIDRNKTYKHEENHQPFNNDGFLFFIDQSETAKKEKIYNFFSTKKNN